jgi:hypothetical protein
MKHTYEFVKEQIEKEGYELFSSEYVNNCTKLKLQCREGHDYLVTYGNFHSGRRCPICSCKKKIFFY